MRPGSTLVELLVVVAMLGVMFAVVGPSLMAAETGRAPSLASTAMSARHDAIATGRPAIRIHDVRGVRLRVSARPDGRVSLDSAGVRRTLLTTPGDASP